LKKAVVLLSGGLDSLAVCGFYQSEYKIELALTFDYGQKSANAEIYASDKICKFYGINHKIIKLDWLKDITKTALVTDKEVPETNLGTAESAAAVWVPNRNGLFLNIAASFADSFGYDYILFGANKDEGATFPDNTEEFRAEISKVFENSTLKKPKVLAPLINYSKNDIVKIAIENAMPLEFVMSCYRAEEGNETEVKRVKHCGVCESCRHLKRALIANHGEKYLSILFNDYENKTN